MLPEAARVETTNYRPLLWTRRRPRGRAQREGDNNNRQGNDDNGQGGEGANQNNNQNNDNYEDNNANEQGGEP